MRINSRVRGWTVYAIAWIPVAVLYGRLIAGSRHVSLLEAAYYAVDYALFPALLGVVVWRLTARIRWPAQSPVTFFLVHALLAITYGLIWLVFIFTTIAWKTGWTRGVAITSTFAGWQLLSGIWTYCLTAGIGYAIRVSGTLKEKEAARARAEAARSSAELSALRGQLNPHFLFNTLHTVTALVRRDPQTAEGALEQFSDMLRYVLDVNRSEHEDVTLEDEMEFVRNFLSLEQLRLGDRLRVVEQIGADTLDCLIPSLTLQPLVENAVKYAVAPNVNGGTIEITSSVEGSSLVLEISDDGPGVADASAGGAGVGLRAVRQRLQARYPDQSSFEVRTSPGHGFSIRVSLPARAGVRKASSREQVA